MTTQTLRNGDGKDLAMQPGETMLVVAVTGSYSASIISGTGAPSIIATNATGGIYGPYTGGAVVRLRSSELSEVDFDIGTAPVLVSDTPVMAATNPLTGGIELLAGGVAIAIGARQPILDNASAGAESGWLPISNAPERFAYQLDSGTTTTGFAVDISADGVSSLGQAFTGTWASSTVAEITFPIMFSNPLAKFFRWTVLSGGPLSVTRGV